MAASNAEPITIAIDGGGSVSGLLQAPARSRACTVLAHGAGAGMTHPFMAAVAAGLSERGIATLRYQFPYMERGGKRPDPPKVAHAAVRAAVAAAAKRLPKLPLVAGGKSFGGRMTSQAQALAPLPGVVGLAFLGFPLHPPKQPSQDRGKHLFDVRVPMLFLQGTRDALAMLDQIEPLCDALARDPEKWEPVSGKDHAQNNKLERDGDSKKSHPGPGSRTTLKLFADADHSFHVPARSGRKDAEVMSEMLDAFAAWLDGVLANRS